MQRSEPDTLRILDIPKGASGDVRAIRESPHAGEQPFAPTSPWKHILPKKQSAFTNYTIEKDIEVSYLRALSGGTGSWLEMEIDDVDISQYQWLEWMWKVDGFPETGWEIESSSDDFAIRIELIYDYKGGKKNILNFLRKGLITSIFKWYPPELIVSYVWSLNVPPEKPYQSPHTKRMTIIPVESDVALQGRWIHERRNIRDDLDSLTGNRRNLVLTKIRIRSDTDDSGSIAESGIKYIYLIEAEK